MFLKCKHTTGSGSGAGNSTKDLNQSQQIAVTLKSILDELKERKEDYEKLKQKVERLEVGEKSLISLKIEIKPNFINFLGITERFNRFVGIFGKWKIPNRATWKSNEWSHWASSGIQLHHLLIDLIFT